METSAKTGVNVTEIFTAIGKQEKHHCKRPKYSPFSKNQRKSFQRPRLLAPDRTLSLSSPQPQTMPAARRAAANALFYMKKKNLCSVFFLLLFCFFSHKSTYLSSFSFPK